MPDIINPQFTHCQLLDYQPMVDMSYCFTMNKKITTGDRIKIARGSDSLATVAKKLACEGVSISPQGIHKWEKGGEIPESSLAAFCNIYSLSSAYIRYGITHVVQDDIIELAILINSLPEEDKNILKMSAENALENAKKISSLSGIIEKDRLNKPASQPNIWADQQQIHQKVKNEPIDLDERRGRLQTNTPKNPGDGKAR